MTCHRAHNVFDVVPGDVVGSVILATSAATVQVCRLTPDMQVLLAEVYTAPASALSGCLVYCQSLKGKPHVLPALALMPSRSTRERGTPLMLLPSRPEAAKAMVCEQVLNEGKVPCGADVRLLLRRTSGRTGVGRWWCTHAARRPTPGRTTRSTRTSSTPSTSRTPASCASACAPTSGALLWHPAPYHAAACLPAKHAEAALCSRLVEAALHFWACDGVCWRWGSGLKQWVLHC